jgi:hypothetical protein
MKENLFCSSVISHNGGKALLLYPTMDKNLLRCIPHWQQKIKVNNYNQNNFFSKMIFTHKSGPQVEQFDEKYWR